MINDFNEDDLEVLEPNLKQTIKESLELRAKMINAQVLSGIYFKAQISLVQ